MAWQSRAKGRGGIVVAAWLAAVLAGVACGGPPAKAPAAEALRAPPPLDLGVARRVALGFRPAGADWITGQETFQTRVAAGGAIRFVARRPAARRGPARPSETAPALALETVAIAGLGGAGDTAIGPGRARADGAGGLVVERGGVRERLRNLDDGLEQAWELAARPAGTADVVIRVRVAGLAFAGETAGGLHFVDRASGLGVRYGAATFVDARARRTDLRVSYAAGELRLTVPRALLDGAAYPAVVDPYLTPELGLDNPVRGPGIDAYAAASATDGSVTLVVWVDYLDTITHIFGTRVSAAGAVLDPLGITIGTTTAIQANPAVGFGGASFLVAWEQGASSDKKVYVTRINPSNGTVMDPNGIAVSTNTFNDELQPAVSFDGTNFLVAWGVGMGSGGRIAAARLSQAGTLLDTTSLTVSTISSTYTEAQVRPALAFDGVNTLVAWEDIRNGSRDIYANRLTKAGQVLDGNGFVLATSANQKQLPKLAFDGTNTLAVWVDWIDTSTTNRDSSIVGRRVSPAGTLVDANPITISAAAGEQSDPAVAFDGTRYLVAWSDYRGADTDVYATRVGTDGTVVDPQGLPVIVAPAAQYTPELVFLAGKYFLAWVDSRGGRSSIYGARVGTDGVSVDGTGFPLPNVPNTQDTPAAASDGSRYFVVWADSRTDGPGIRGAHVTPEGQVVESTSLRVSTSPGYNSRPVVAWNGSVYLVVWSGDTRLLARRFSAAGTPLDAADIPIPSLALLSDVTSNGTDFLVVGNEVTGFDIQGVRVSGAGVLLDAAPISICAASGSQYNPRATFDGSDYFVIWPDRRDAQGHVYGARVTAAGTVLDPDGFLLSPPTGVTADYQSDPDVAFDGTNILVVWHDSRNYSIRGTRVTPAGALLDPTSAVIVSPASNLDVIGTPHVKFDGTNFVVSADHANFNSSNQIISYATTASRLTTTLATLDATSILSYPTEQLKVAPAARSSPGRSPPRSTATRSTGCGPASFPKARPRVAARSRVSARAATAWTDSAATPPAAAGA
jgi:hypothetical protein